MIGASTLILLDEETEAQGINSLTFHSNLLRKDLDPKLQALCVIQSYLFLLEKLFVININLLIQNVR